MFHCQLARMAVAGFSALLALGAGMADASAFTGDMGACNATTSSASTSATPVLVASRAAASLDNPLTIATPAP